MAISKSSILFVIVIVIFMATLTGCGGDSNDPQITSEPAQPGDLPGGIWTGTVTFDTGENLDAVGVVSKPYIYDEFYESFDSNFLITDERGQQMAGELVPEGTTTTDSTKFSASGEWGIPLDSTNSTTITQGQGTVFLNGTVMERSQLTGSFEDPEGAFTGTFEFTYDPLYERDSALSTIAGMYGEGSNQLTIDAQGNMFGQDAGTGCVLNGQVSILDSEYNYYLVDLEVANCAGEEAILNGLSFSGSSFLDDTMPPDEVLTIQATTDDPEGYTGVDMTLVRQ